MSEVPEVFFLIWIQANYESFQGVTYNMYNKSEFQNFNFYIRDKWEVALLCLLSADVDGSY